MISNKYVEEYRQLYKDDKIKLNKERMQLFDWLDKNILNDDDLYFDEEKIENFIRFCEKWYFPLEPFQKFIIAFIFLYHRETQLRVFKEFFLTMGRGAGKNGLISALSHFFISPLYDVENYDISIIANSEQQAMRSFDDVYNTIDKHQLDKQFVNGRAQIRGKNNHSILRAMTSNANTKDGGREGAVIFDEIHEFANQKTVGVLMSGLGKVPDSRVIYIGTNGYVRGGFFDSLMDRAHMTLNGEFDDTTFFPFICKLDDKDEVKDSDMWEKANPMLSKPRGKYAAGLFEEIESDYKRLTFDESAREEFMTKRMNFPEKSLAHSIATIEELKATKQKVPDLEHSSCIAGLDYATLRDFAAVGLLFRNGDEYIWKGHSFVRKDFVDRVYAYSEKGAHEKQRFAPIKKWEDEGWLTVIDEPSMSPYHIIQWLDSMREHYDIQKVIADNYRMDLIRPILEEYGFEYEILRNPRSLHGLLAPRITDAFANHRINFGDNDMMRWYTNNVVVQHKNGNVVYDKEENVRRKTDGFHAFLHAMYRADEIEEVNVDSFLDMIDNIDF
ncbi:terminase large subunit [Tetragenococcus halophilus]|uniref:Terminase large subunit n=1 Tax=Tetragenococcus halophilus TaxID=51669 RepID=A0A3G5FKJ7_TETHA|nr:terminase TerL endonuclease subunit [Tetragenococcus halophilus]AYW50801.1 terminase large subunit [Tetragenococcus halophilus]GBD64883.1 hypothetical protein TEHD23766T_2310 [Tetragenococcus halophilus subsp. flandriensis]GMA08860.1 terminase large subunit [Tetragenococcus halophilus subsp. flandriensis]